MTTQEIAADLVALCKQGRFEESGEKYWADDVLSVEFGGDDPRARGKAAVKAKGEWFMNNHEIHAVEVEGPYINGDQFVVRFRMEMTPKTTGKRVSLDEVGLYTLRAGKIAEERFFHAG